MSGAPRSSLWQENVTENDIANVPELLKESAAHENITAKFARVRGAFETDLIRFWQNPLNNKTPLGPGEKWWLRDDDDIEDMIKTFLLLKTQYSKPNARKTEEPRQNIKWSTLVTWICYLRSLISIRLDRTRKELKYHLHDSLHKHGHYLCQRYDLVVVPSDKTYCGRPEIRLISEVLWASNRGLLVKLQHDVLVKGAFSSGMRPSTLGYYDAADKLAGRYVQLRDITIYVPEDMSFVVDIIYRSLKANGTKMKGKILCLTYRSVLYACNIIFEFPVILVTYLLQRGVLEDINTLEDLRNWKYGEIRIKKDCLTQPLFLKVLPQGAGLDLDGLQPMSSHAMTEVIKQLGHEAGLGDITMYSIRRDVADEVTSEAGLDKAQLVLGQEERSRVTHRHYTRGGRGVDVGGIRAGEGQAPRGTLFAPTCLAHTDAAASAKRSAEDTLKTMLQPDRKRATDERTGDHGNTKKPRISKAEKEQHPAVIACYSKPTYIEQQARFDEARAELTVMNITITQGKHINKLSLADQIKNLSTPELKAKATKLVDDFTRARNAMNTQRTKAYNSALELARKEKAMAGRALQTRKDRDAIVAQFAEPSVLLKAAVQGDTLKEKAHTSNSQDASASEDVSKQFMRIDDLPLVSTITGEDGEEIETRDATLPEVDLSIDDMPAPECRLRYISMLITLGAQPVRSGLLCNICPRDQTVHPSMYSQEYTAFTLEDHKKTYHTLERQLRRFVTDGHHSDPEGTRGTCFLCWTDRVPPTRKYTPDALGNHFDATRSDCLHVCDPRLPFGWRGVREVKTAKRSIMLQPAIVDLMAGAGPFDIPLQLGTLENASTDQIDFPVAALEGEEKAVYLRITPHSVLEQAQLGVRGPEGLVRSG